MMRKKQDGTMGMQDAAYREESLRLPFLVLAVALALVAAPLAWAISRIDTAGAKAADVSKYNALVQIADADAAAVRAMLESGPVEPEAAERVVALIVPELVLVDEAKPAAPLPLKIHLKGIYWNPTRPLVDIDNETYRVGDAVRGYTIVEIGKTAVHFKAKDGTIVVKDFYENLLEIKK